MNFPSQSRRVMATATRSSTAFWLRYGRPNVRDGPLRQGGRSLLRGSRDMGDCSELARRSIVRQAHGMKPLLLLPQKHRPDDADFWRAAVRRGWETLRLGRTVDPADFRG